MFPCSKELRRSRFLESCKLSKVLSYGIKIKKKTKEVILNHERTWIVDEQNWDSLLLQELISFLKVSIAHYWEILLSFRMLIIFRLT